MRVGHLQRASRDGSRWTSCCNGSGRARRWPAPTWPARSSRPRSRTSCRRVGARPLHGVAALDLGHQGDDAAQHGRARHRGARAARTVPPTTCCGRRPDGVFLSNGPGRPGDRRPRRSSCLRGCSQARRAVLRHLLRQPGARPGARVRHLQAAATATAASTSRCWTGPPGGSRSPRTTTGSRSTRRCGAGADATGLRTGRGQPRLPQRRRRRGPALPRRAGVLACSTTRRRRPARTTPPTCSTASCELDGRPDALMPRRDDIALGPGDRLRADRDRAGLRVRLLRHAGLPGAARRGPARGPGQLATRPRS